ncbi:hypothetical protein [Streptomyces griseus]
MTRSPIRISRASRTYPGIPRAVPAALAVHPGDGTRRERTDGEPAASARAHPRTGAGGTGRTTPYP